MAKEKVQINDFNLFTDAVKALSKFADAAKFSVSDTGLTVYSKNACARCELVTNAITTANDVEFNIENLQTLLKILNTIKEVHENDFSSLDFSVDLPSIRFSSKKFKTKLMTINDVEMIKQWISQKVTAELKPVFEFTTTSDMIKRLNNHSFIFSNPESLRIYLNTDKELENNVLFATLGNEANDLNNSMTLKFGLVTFGTLGDRKLILDFDRLNVFNTIPSNDIKVQLMDKSALVSNVKLTGKNDTFFNLTIYNSLRKS